MLTAVLEFEEHHQSSDSDADGPTTRPTHTGYTAAAAAAAAGDITDGTDADAAGGLIVDAGASEHAQPCVSGADHSMVAQVCQSLAMLHYLLNDNHTVGCTGWLNHVA